MSFYDILATFDDKSSMAAFTVAGSPWLCANSYDQGAADSPPAGPQGVLGGPVLRDIGRGELIRLVVQINTAVTSGGAATVKVDLIAADDGPLTTNKNIIVSTPAIAKATLVAGYRFRLPALAPGMFSLNSNRYVGVQYTVATADLTAGAVSAYLNFQNDDNADILG